MTEEVTPHTWEREQSGWQCTNCAATWPPEAGKLYVRVCVDMLKINAEVRDQTYD